LNLTFAITVVVSVDCVAPAAVVVCSFFHTKRKQRSQNIKKIILGKHIATGFIKQIA
jgi:hypothetical protein